MKKTLAASLLAATVLLQSASAFAEDSAKLIRTYQESEKATYTLRLNVDQNGQKMEMSSTIIWKVKKVSDKGIATGTLTAEKFSMKENDQESGAGMAPPDFSGAFGPKALPDTLAVRDAEVVFAVFSLASVLPGKEVKVGDKFDIAWENEDKTFSVSGNGKLLELTTFNGEKAAKMEMTLEVKPGGDTPATVKLTSYVSVQNGALLKSEGSVEIGGEGHGKFTVEKGK